MSIIECGPVRSRRMSRALALLVVVISLATLVCGTVVAAAPPSSESPPGGSNSGVVMAIGLALMAAGTCLIVGFGRRSQ